MNITRRDMLKYLSVISASTLLPFSSSCSSKLTKKNNDFFWHHGNFPPVSEEVTVLDLPVEGKIPDDLSGLYLRNGANSWQGLSEHFFFGDGMLHGIQFKNGSASWYRNRYVQTPLLYKKMSIFPKKPTLDETMSNVSVIYHGKKLLALGELGAPYEIDSSNLSTKGIFTYNNKLTTNMTAHPKIDPVTGEMHFFGYNVTKPYLTYMVANSQGRLIHHTTIDTEGPTLMHDFAMTENYVLFFELPVCFSWKKILTQRLFPFQWDSTAISRIGVLKKQNPGTEITWFSIPPCYIFHTLNAYEQNGKIILDAPRFEKVWVKDARDFHHPAFLTRFTLDLKKRVVNEHTIDDKTMTEFPQINRKYWGRPYTIGYSLIAGTQKHGLSTDDFIGIKKYNLHNNTSEEIILKDHYAPSEPFFVPSLLKGDKEDNGYLVNFMYNKKTKLSEFWIRDSEDIAAPPRAKIHLPVRVPNGFHGLWVSDFL